MAQCVLPSSKGFLFFRIMKLRIFVKYIPPPCQNSPAVSNDEIIDWKERMKYLYEDLNWLLKLSDVDFWSQVKHFLDNN